MTAVATGPTIVDVMEDPNLLAPAFEPAESWSTWKSYLRVLFGLGHTAGDLATYHTCTSRVGSPMGPYRESWTLCGRRAGKSRIAALIALYLAAFKTYRVAPGETPIVMLIASDKSQAKVLLGYLAGMLESSPLLGQLIENRSPESVSLSNNVRVEVHANSYRGVRGRTLAACICDEICFWRSDTSANPDSEVIAAVRPSLATVPGSMLIAISSPHSKTGVAFQQYQRCFAKADPRVLLWQSSSAMMNPTLDPQVIADAYSEDENVAASEFGGRWRNDLEGYASRELVEACIVPGVEERAWLSAIRFQAFVDVSGGAHDSAVLAIGHSERRDARDVAVVDCVRERRAPFDPEDVTREFAEILKSYRVSTLVGDRYGGEWPASAFDRHGIRYEPASKTKSELYKELLPALRSRSVELPDSKRLIAQLCQLERRSTRGGAEVIDHPVGSRDDIANAVAGVAYIVGGRRNMVRIW